MFSVPSQIDSACILKSYSLKANFNIILPLLVYHGLSLSDILTETLYAFDTCSLSDYRPSGTFTWYTQDNGVQVTTVIECEATRK